MMKDIVIAVDEDALRKARQYAGEQDATLEALLEQHLAILADRAGRRLTLREQTYVGCEPPEDVAEALRRERCESKQKAP